MPASPTVRERKNRRFQRAKEIDRRLSLLHHLDESDYVVASHDEKSNR
jgi:hypothetical protein